MTNATLQAFRQIADDMRGNVTADWQWIGPHMSQRMFGITRERAEGYAKRHGGMAEQMQPSARLQQEFTGGYHLIGPDGKVVAFSLSLDKAQEICKDRGWRLR